MFDCLRLLLAKGTYGVCGGVEEIGDFISSLYWQGAVGPIRWIAFSKDWLPEHNAMLRGGGGFLHHRRRSAQHHAISFSGFYGSVPYGDSNSCRSVGIDCDLLLKRISQCKGIGLFYEQPPAMSRSVQNQNGTTGKDESVLGKIQLSERYYEVAFVFRCGGRLCA